ncbi:hypothetical protein BGZ60DRAFT_446050 [Tricladium varicosporioides]|nr:hypothetical protein BGZ60DRAFT_446050 [Hymenoscyphus varicosporioides]
MRLIEIKGPGEFSLVQVPTHNTLPYAILSHTWTSQEVTYQDLISGAGKSKSGYKKISFCEEQATRDGLRYIWVDTCCIDKSNSTELSTAINSMFRWYQNAKKCYVYLTDVLAPSYNRDVKLSQSAWEAAFRGSKWFTRGWTLQELIAPVTVEFFSKDHTRLGDKKSLERLIYEITQIPVQALRGNPFSDFSVAERKRWVAGRQTTEEEDLVYCLLGLCEVSMLPIYGEGKTAAMKRLQITIKDFSKDTNKLEDLEDLENLKENIVPFIVPFDRNLNFTGRGTQLAEAEEKLFMGGQTIKVAITGLGGIGKTQLVLELVYRIRDRYRNCLVIWIPATNIESLFQAYQDVARQLKIPGSEEDKVDPKSLVQGYLNMKSAGRWLLVFDNADDINMWIEPGSDRLVDYLPRSEQGCIVFTTRDRKTATKLVHQNIIVVPEMGEDVAIQLLQKCLVNPSFAKTGLDAKALLKELTYLPLAIIQAAAYINENNITFTDYLSLLKDQEEEVIDLLSEEFEDDGRYYNIKNPVATTWLVSFEQIRHRDPLAADYLSFMCCIDSRNIPQLLLPPGPSRKKEIEAIGTLDAYSFISKRPADLALDIHRLVHLSTRNWLRKENLLAQSTEMVIVRLEEMFPDDDHKNRSAWRTYLPHARYILESRLVVIDSRSRMRLLWKYGMCLYEDGRWIEAEDAITKVMKMKKRVLGEEHPDTLLSMGNLAVIYQNQGHFQEAGELELQVMETRKRALGEEHPNTLISMGNLAMTYQSQGRFDEAEQLELQVIATQRRVLGEEHPNTLISMGNLAMIFWNQGRWTEVEDLEVQVMETKKRVLGQEHPGTLASMANLASTYQNLGRWKEAEELQGTELEICSRVLGHDHPDTLTSMANLALIWKGYDKDVDAIKLMKRCVEVRASILGANHPHTLSSSATLLEWETEKPEVSASAGRE